jgi:hypothetical protein
MAAPGPRTLGVPYLRARLEHALDLRSALVLPTALLPHVDAQTGRGNMHPKFAERLKALTTPFRIPRPRPDTSRVTVLVNLNVLKAPQEFWDRELERRLKEYRNRFKRKNPNATGG